MQNNPAEEWRSLTETYRAMFDGELENLAGDMGDLNETAREVLRAEMKSRGLAMPGETRAKAEAARFARAGDLDAGGDELERDEEPGTGEDEGRLDAPVEFTWKTPLCECESRGQAWEIHKALGESGIESWVEEPGRDQVSRIRVVVGADQLEEARVIAARPIPQDVLDEYEQPIAEYEPPKCPKCGEEDPVLESAERANSWLCEACGYEWTDPGADLETGA